MSSKKPILSRRNFLMTVGAGSAAGAAAIVTRQVQQDAPDAKDKHATSGYRVSEHVQNYYRTTKV